MYQSGGTIKKLMSGIEEGKYILPAIQREFVWKPEQICQLFDSLMQGYPFGTFLFWKIKPEHIAEYQFYSFVRFFHERDRYHCEAIESLPQREFLAVLDGQQRITSLNIGLRGSYAWKVGRQRWANDDAFPERKLYLNLFGRADEESGSIYQFEFLTDEVALTRDNENFWIQAGRSLDEDTDILEDEVFDALDELGSPEQKKSARATLRTLIRTVREKATISYYEEEDQSLEKVLNIFIRMNSGGTPLSYSDLLLSVAVAQWSALDARHEIHSLVDAINAEGNGFNFSKDFVLKAGLMLSDIGSVGFKVENFNKDNMLKLESKWDDGIRPSLLLMVRLLHDFGFNGQNLPADSAVLPIAYYLYFRNFDDNYRSKATYSDDRDQVRRWFIRSILKKGIWGSGLDTLLTDLRKTIQQHGESGFPIQEIERVMSGRGKNLRFDDDEVEQLLELKYGDKRTFALLSLIFHGHDYAHQFHVDHIFPQGRFTVAQLAKIGIDTEVAKEWIEKSNKISNLQLLEGSVNNEKRKQMPHEWYKKYYSSPQAIQAALGLQAIEALPTEMNGFADFYEAIRVRGRTK